MNDISLGLLEFGDRGDKNSLSAINEIIEYATVADKLNYTRFWLGEHHGPDSRIPYTNPDILLTIIAGMTENIRVGSAGTLIKMYEPYSVVTNFKLLNNLFSGRVDLGLAKGNPGIKYLKEKIDFSKKGLYSQKISEIAELINNEQYNFEEKEVIIPPYKGDLPELWYLSSSYNNFDDIIKYKFNVSRSLFHGQEASDIGLEKENLIKHKEIFFSKNGFYPKVNIAVGISIGKTIKEAKEKFELACKKEGVSLSQAWKIIPVTLNSLFDLLNEYRDSYGVDEFILFDINSNNEEKINSIFQIAEKFKLTQLN